MPDAHKWLLASCTQVAVSSNNLGVEGGKALAECLQSNTTITQVCYAFSCACKLRNVHSNHLFFKIYLAHKCLFASCTQVEAFGCAFGAEGGKAMAEALEANKTLEEITVCNVIVGSTVKLKSSGELKVLTNVDSDGNVIYEGSGRWAKPSTFEPIPAVLPLKKLRDNTITELDLKNSGLGVDGGMMLAAMLKSNSSVTKVSDVWLV